MRDGAFHMLFDGADRYAKLRRDIAILYTFETPKHKNNPGPFRKHLQQFNHAGQALPLNQNVFRRKIHIPMFRFFETFVGVAVAAAAIAKVVGKDTACCLEEIAAEMIDRFDAAAPQ